MELSTEVYQSLVVLEDNSVSSTEGLQNRAE